MGGQPGASLLAVGAAAHPAAGTVARATALDRCRQRQQQEPLNGPCISWRCYPRQSEVTGPSRRITHPPQPPTGKSAPAGAPAPLLHPPAEPPAPQPAGTRSAQAGGVRNSGVVSGGPQQVGWTGRGMLHQNPRPNLPQSPPAISLWATHPSQTSSNSADIGRR